MKYGGDGTRVPEDENAHKAFVGNFAAQYKILQTNARNWKRLYGRHGWRPHAAGHARLCALLLTFTPDLRATEFGYTPDLIEATELIMQMEDKSDL